MESKPAKELKPERRATVAGRGLDQAGALRTGANHKNRLYQRFFESQEKERWKCLPLTNFSRPTKEQSLR
jgi:hypothetical protein